MLICRRSLLPCLATLLVLAAPLGFAQSAGAISLTVDATQTASKMLHSHLVIPVKSGPLTLYYPKWIPGAHSPSGPIGDLTGLKFTADGKTISWRRDLLDVFAFHVDVPAGATHLDVSYDIIESRSATDKLMVLEWNQALLYPAGTPSSELTYDAKLILPESWKYGTALPIATESGNEVTFKPISLNLLVDSPVIAGQYYRAIDVTPPGEPIHHEIDIAADSEAALNMSPVMQEEMTNLVTESEKLFGARHYRDYHFLLHLTADGGGGLEHHESQDSGAPERSLLGPEASAQVGRLLTHEFVHSWNGKFRRPYDLATPDFEKPMEDDLLWVYEGLTDFLGPVLTARSGLYTPEEYHEYLATVAAMEGPDRTGRTWRPLVDTAVAVAGGGGGGAGAGAGARGWTDWRRTGHDYYDEGGLLWLEVATIIHDVTQGQKSIDDFCHVFYSGPNNGPELKPYTLDSLVETLNQVAPYDWATFFHQHVDSISPDMPEGGILNAGWKVEFNNKPLRMPGLPARLGNPGDVYTIGLELGPDGTVMDSVAGGPAFNAGISPGMKVAGVDGRLYTHDVLEDAIKAAADSSAPITLLVVDDDYYRTTAIDYHGGERYPHLVREDGKPDYLDELIKAHAQ